MGVRTRLFQRAVVVILVLAVPLFLITTNLNVVINSGWLYSFGFNRHDIAVRTGIEPRELTRISEEIKSYFNNSEERLDVQAVDDGREQELFSEREILHMGDVKGLVRGVGFWQRVSFFTIVGAALAALFVIGRRRALAAVGRGLVGGSVLTFGILAALGIGSLISFDELFNRFHLIGFSNDLWLLDPRTDNLIRIFPQGFFLDATLIIAGLTLGQAALTGGVSAFFLWRHRQRGEAASAGSARRVAPAGKPPTA